MLVDNTAFISTIDPLFNTSGPREWEEQRIKSYIVKPQRLIMALPPSAAAVANISTFTFSTGKTYTKFDFRTPNTVVYDAGTLNSLSKSDLNVALAHEFFHIASDQNDMDLANNLGLGKFNIYTPGDHVRASDAISKFIAGGCMK